MPVRGNFSLLFLLYVIFWPKPTMEAQKEPYSNVQIKLLENKGEVNEDPGINVIARDEIFKGYYRDSLLYGP
jgi:outer membrane receptor for ferrienterochelin and colicin